MKTYILSYDYQPLLEVKIDHQLAETPIKEMVEFWSGWEYDLEENNNNYTTTWLKNLIRFYIRRGRIPKNDEGWCSFEGKFGITVKSLDYFDISDDNINIEEK